MKQYRAVHIWQYSMAAAHGMKLQATLNQVKVGQMQQQHEEGASRGGGGGSAAMRRIVVSADEVHVNDGALASKAVYELAERGGCVLLAEGDMDIGR